jgi:hypothetical protein
MTTATIASGFLEGLWPSAKAIFRAFVFPDTGLEVPAWLLTALLVAGVFLVVAGSLTGALGKGKVYGTLAMAAGAGVAAWVFMGGRRDVAEFFVVITLVLGFLGGIAFVVGFFRTPWVALGLLLCVFVAAAGIVPARTLGLLLSVAASVLGAWSLYRKFEGYSPGRRGSRWNQRTAIGWTVCLLAASMLEAPGLGSHGRNFKLAGMIVGAAALILLPRVKVAPKAG